MRVYSPQMTNLSPCHDSLLAIGLEMPIVTFHSWILFYLLPTASGSLFSYQENEVPILHHTESYCSYVLFSPLPFSFFPSVLLSTSQQSTTENVMTSMCREEFATSYHIQSCARSKSAINLISA